MHVAHLVTCDRLWYVIAIYRARGQKKLELVSDACHENKRKKHGQKVCKPPRQDSCSFEKFV